MPPRGGAVSWETLQKPVVTFDFSWKVLDVTPPPDEENASYRELSVSDDSVDLCGV